MENIIAVKLAELHPFPNHPFQVREDDAMRETVESIREYGVMMPIIVRNREEGGYEIISGHRRKRACEIAGIDSIPVIIRDLDYDSAVIAMVRRTYIQKKNNSKKKRPLGIPTFTDTRTVQSGSISRGKNDPAESLQMIERALMTSDELKSLPKGTFVVTKTGAYPMQVKLKLFFEWGIAFTDELYNVPDKGNRIVAYARKDDLQKKMEEIYPTPKKEEQKATAAAEKVHRPENNGRFHKPRQSEIASTDHTDSGIVVEEADDSAEEGEIYDEGV